MRFKTTLIGFTLVSSLALQGCYTQLAMFYPDPEEELETYSRAGARPSVDMYAQDLGSGSSLAYSTMQNRFSPFNGYNNYYNPYRFYNDPYSGYGGYGFGYNNYGYSYNLGGYDMFVPFIPVAGEKDIRQFTKDRNRTTTTNLQVIRTSNTNENSGLHPVGIVVLLGVIRLAIIVLQAVQVHLLEVPVVVVPHVVIN